MGIGPSSPSYLAEKLKCVLDTAFILYFWLPVRSRSLTVPISSAETTLNKVSQIEMQFEDNKIRVTFSKTEHGFPHVHSEWFCIAFPDPGTKAQPFKNVKLNISEC